MGLATPSTGSRKKGYHRLCENLEFRKEVPRSFYADARVEGVAYYAKKGAGREILHKNILAKEWPPFEKALVSEWEQWLRFGAATVVPPGQAPLVPRDKIARGWPIFTDENAGILFL